MPLGHFILKAPFRNVVVRKTPVTQVNAMLEGWRAKPGLLAVGIPPQIKPRFPVHELGCIPFDLDELEEVEMRVPAVVQPLRP